MTAAPAPDAASARRFRSLALDPQTLEHGRIISHLNDEGARRAYKILRTRVLRRLQTNQWNAFAVTGVSPGEGKTLTAINLALALAQDINTWVFLIDLDLERPRIAEYLGIGGAGAKGLSDYLDGRADLEDIAYSPGIVERLAVIPNFEHMPQSSELLTSPRMLELMQALEAETPRRIVIADMPPILAADHVLAFAPQVDGVLLVVGEGTTERDALRSAKEVLAEMNLVGVVLNRASERNEYAYYSYSAAS